MRLSATFQQDFDRILTKCGKLIAEHGRVLEVADFGLAMLASTSKHTVAERAGTLGCSGLRNGKFCSNFVKF